MLRSTTFTIVTGGALGVDLEAEKIARYHGLQVNVLIPPSHPRSKSLPPLSHTTLAEVIPATRQSAFRLYKQLENSISLQ